MRPAVVVVACLLFGLLGGCASTRSFTYEGPDHVRTGACEQRSPEVFAISGEIDAELAQCVRDNFADTTRELALDTEGGSVEAALDIVEVIQGHDLTMRVEGECNSSCANYFLPLAERIVVEPNAMILLHGSVDPWTIHRWRERKAEFMAMQTGRGRTVEEAETSFQQLLTDAEALIVRQAAFADRHGVRPGWLLYRVPGSRQVVGLSDQPTRAVAILVEERMMRSCLPGVEIAPYQKTLERRWTRSLRRIGLFWVRIAPSGRAACTAD
ncbi:hypothetical protein ACETK8_07035 [Brevundimonas staleyi]|uniref:Lipoprotein n=1 Tax=Brevundimonas staleyi TaxID=74326 RepID=A0ABW0FUV9_9CAUL